MQAAVREIYVDSTVGGLHRPPRRTAPGTTPTSTSARRRAARSRSIVRARRWPALLGRDYVIPDDVKALAEPALAHRLIIKTSSSIHDVQAGQVVRELLEATAIEGIRPTGGGPSELRAVAARLIDGRERVADRSADDATEGEPMIRQLELLIVAVVLVVAAFSTGFAVPLLPALPRDPRRSAARTSWCGSG